MYIQELSGELRAHMTKWKHENIYLKQASYKERHARNTEGNDTVNFHHIEILTIVKIRQKYEITKLDISK